VQRVAVSSKNLKSVGYDEQLLVLEIEFHTGGVYRYSGVPVAVHAALMRAASKGRYFLAMVKDRYPCVKVR
jgi:hypothetical protein